MATSKKNSKRGALKFPVPSDIDDENPALEAIDLADEVQPKIEAALKCIIGNLHKNFKDFTPAQLVEECEQLVKTARADAALYYMNR